MRLHHYHPKGAVKKIEVLETCLSSGKNKVYVVWDTGFLETRKLILIRSTIRLSSKYSPNEGISLGYFNITSFVYDDFIFTSYWDAYAYQCKYCQLLAETEEGK